MTALIADALRLIRTEGVIHHPRLRLIRKDRRFPEAVREQLGLKLKPAKSPLNVLVDRCGLARQVLRGRAA
jgi:hypothetical protein